MTPPPGIRSSQTPLSLGIFALNTMKYPDASTQAQMEALDFFTEGATERLVALRDATRNA